MLASHADRTCVFAAIDFDLVPVGRVHRALEAVFDRVKPTWMAAGPFHYALRMSEGNCLLNIGAKRLAWSLLGSKYWSDNLADLLSITRAAIDQLGVTKFKRTGFKVIAFIPLGMTREEISRLMFGSFVADYDALSEIFGNTDDPWVQFKGTRERLDYTLTLTAMSKADVSNTLRSIPDISHFRDETGFDDSVRNLHNLISAQECFSFDVDFSQTDLLPAELSKFMSSALNEADTLAKACVDHLRAKP